MHSSFSSRFFFGAGIVVLCLLFSFSATVPALAVDFKISGVWQVGFEHSNVIPRGVRHSDSFGAKQRFRLQLEAIASETLSGTVQFEFGATDWGRAANGGALGADGVIGEVRYAWLDWMVPQTDVKVRMGLQLLRLPGVLSQWGFGPVFGKEMAGISVSSPLYKRDGLTVDATAFWARPYNDNSVNTYGGSRNTTHLDNMDVFALSLPVKGDGFRINPWAMYALIGQYSMTGVSVRAVGGDPGVVAPRGGLMPILGNGNNYAWFQTRGLTALDRAWGDGFWLGLAGDVDITTDLRFGFEGGYGSVNMGTVKNYTGFDGTRRDFEVRRAGWYAGARLDWAQDWGVPGIIAWYGSGDDDNPWNGSERLPQYNTPWGVTALGFGGGTYDDNTWKVLGHNPGGMVAAIAQIDKISFVKDLNHTLRFGMFWGTNSNDMPRRANMPWPNRSDGPMAYLTTSDNAWEVNLVTNYKIYENLQVSLEGAYVRLNLDSDTWRGAEKAMYKDNYRVSAVFTYTF